MKKRHWWSAVGCCAAALGAVTSPGCGEQRAETGTQVEVSDQMKKEAEASAKYFEGQSKKSGTPRK